jgi:ATP-dependent DNA ligase
MPPIQPMLAKSVKGIPDPAKHGGLSFEPKWDGFRCLVFKDGDEVELTSRNTKPLTRYFPEVVAAIREQLPERCVLDGELFVALRGDGGRPAGVRDAAGADPPGRVPDQHARREDAGRVRRVRPVGAG